MEYGVYIDMKNENALYTVSMLSAMLENGTGNYLDLLTPFVLYSLPNVVDSPISIDAVTGAMRDFGFKDFPHKTTEKILDRLCKVADDTPVYVRSTSVNKKKKYWVATVYSNSEFNNSKQEMRRKIDGILKAMQEYFKTHFYYETLDQEEIREKLISFFESNGLTVIQSVGDLKLVQKDSDSDAFEVARFVLEEYEKKSLAYDDLCDVTKGFLTYKAIYYFTDDHKNSMESKFRDVTFYLDCSLVLDALGYDTPEDEKAVKELIRLVRRNGGDVKVFRHTAEEASKLIEAFANQLHNKNKFRLDGLANRDFTRDILLMIAGQVADTLKANVQIETVDTPSLEDASNHINYLGETEIINWLKQNRVKNGEVTYTDEERFGFDAKSLNAICMLRGGYHPNYIEHAKAMLVTQDTWLNRCLRDLYSDRFKSELLFSISDTELVSLLWLRDYKEVSNLPSDILIANAHAACRVSQEVMDRAIQIATSMVEAGTLNLDAALLVTAHSDFKCVLAERVRNNPEMLSEHEIKETINAYISQKASAQIESAREDERKTAQKKLSSQKTAFAESEAGYEAKLEARDAEIDRLKKQMEKNQKDQADKKIARAERYATTIANWCYNALMAILLLADLLLIIIFGIQCWKEFVEGDAWIPYLIIEILGFIGVPSMLLAKESPCHKRICRYRDKIHSRLYSFFLQHD